MMDPSLSPDKRAKLGRLHSLLFGVQNALAKEDYETAIGLALRLLGFLVGETRSPEDEVYIRKILSQVHLNLDSARRATHSDRDALEHADCPEGFHFSQIKPIDMQRIKSSIYFVNARIRADENEADRSSLSAAPSLPSRPSSSRVTEGPGSTNSTEQSPKPGRSLCQATLTSLYSGSSTRLRERCSLPTVDQEDIADPLEADRPVGNYRPLPSQIADVGLADFIHSPADFVAPTDNEDKEVGPKRGRSAYLSRPAKKKLRLAAGEDDSDEEILPSRRFQNKMEPAVRGDFSDDDTVKRCRSTYLNRSQGKMKSAKQDESDDDLQQTRNGFVTAKQKLAIELRSKPPSTSYQVTGGYNLSTGAKTLGMTRRGVRGPFVPPVKYGGGSGCVAAAVSRQQPADHAAGEATLKCLELLAGPDGELPDRLRNLEPRLLEHVSNEIMDQDPNVRWDDIAGLEHAKKCVTEMVIWPLLRPDIFQGCRSPGKGLLLFGPPGTGKTMIGKAIAGEAKATFFSISASSLTSKWIGEGEKLVRALFGVASCRQPAVIFIDEVDSLLSQRKADGEHESSRRLKTQFLIEMEGCGSGSEQILLIGATNRPQELDEAARRRLSKRLYIPLPSDGARAWIVRNLLQKDGLLSLSNDDIDVICTRTQGYSGSDMKNLVKEASMGPLREALTHGKDISKINNDEMRPITVQDFITAMQQVRPSVSQSELGLYEDWNKQFGSLAL